MFQHTAARRRLEKRGMHRRLRLNCFNTQPPEGGWRGVGYGIDPQTKFQHTAARRRLVFLTSPPSEQPTFQHTAARRRLGKARAISFSLELFQHTAARRRLALSYPAVISRECCFNTQPPEGGWIHIVNERKE